ncbi:MAG: hypothetical protein U9O94_01305 [Nanoarchaeota archaeon]|nr:hypothetical protein [Nanoarchaeota archaeon]
MTFYAYLQDIHAAQYVGTDDCMPDDFEEWLQDLDIEEWLEYGTSYCVAEKVKMVDEETEQALQNLRKIMEKEAI